MGVFPCPADDRNSAGVVQIIRTIGSNVAKIDIAATLIDEDAGPWVTGRIKHNYAPKKATLVTDNDEYLLSAFFPRMPKKLVRRTSDEVGGIVSAARMNSGAGGRRAPLAGDGASEVAGSVSARSSSVAGVSDPLVAPRGRRAPSEPVADADADDLFDQGEGGRADAAEEDEPPSPGMTS